MKNKFVATETYICSGVFRELHFYAKKLGKDNANTGVVQSASRLEFVAVRTSYNNDPNVLCNIITDTGQTMMVAYPFNVFSEYILPLLTRGVYEGVLTPFKVTHRARLSYLLPNE